MKLAGIYAQALMSSEEGTTDAVLMKQLVAHLETKGRLKLLPSIGRELRRIAQKSDLHAAHVEVAHKKDAAHALAAAKAAGIEGAHAQVNETLISGWRARSGGTLVDESGKRALIDLYRQIISGRH